jgi:hypothetical protein
MRAGEIAFIQVSVQRRRIRASTLAEYLERQTIGGDE